MARSRPKTTAAAADSRPERPSATVAHDPEALVARRLAALREEAGITLRELGEKTGLSDAYLSRVEHGQAAITIASLARLAAVFGTPLAAFFEEPEPPVPLVVCRAGAGAKFRFRGRNGSLVELLAEAKRLKHMEPLIVEVGSARREVPLQAHAGEEFNYVLSGRCRFLFGEEVHPLAKGDAVYFDAAVPHAVRPIDGETCQLLAVVTASDFRAHADIGKVLEGRIQA